MKKLSLRIEAIDGLFFRDGRPFDATRVMGGLPFINTFASALRFYLLEHSGVCLNSFKQALYAGANFSEASTKLSGDISSIGNLRIRFFAPACFKHNTTTPLFAMPRNLRTLKSNPDKTVILSPLKAPPSCWQKSLHPLWAKGSSVTEKSNLWLNTDEFSNYLSASLPINIRPTHQNWYKFDTRTGIKINPQSNQAEDGEIYSTTLLTPKPDYGFYAEIECPDALLSFFPSTETTFPFGGEARRARLSVCEKINLNPTLPNNADGELLYLSSPCPLNSQGELEFQNQLTALSLGVTQVHSGWDLARHGPRASRAFAPTGTVLFLKPGVQAPQSLCEGEDHLLGLGQFFKGIWNYV